MTDASGRLTANAFKQQVRKSLISTMSIVMVIVPCSEEKDQENRRTEFKIKKF